MKSAGLAFLTCALLLCAQGQPTSRSSRCKCSNNFLSWIHPRMIKELAVYEPSVFCSRTEIIITTENTKKCVNPVSHLGKLILEKRKKKTEAKTTASTQTSMSSSTRHHTTSRLENSTAETAVRTSRAPSH